MSDRELSLATLAAGFIAAASLLWMWGQHGAPQRFRRCPLWVKSGHRGVRQECPLYPQERT